MMKRSFLLVLTIALCNNFIAYSHNTDSISKLRVVISTDFPPLDVCMSGCASDHTSDPDDVQSMVRFLLYANEFDVEGLIASSATFSNLAKKQNILDIIDLYDKVDGNLRKHDANYPTAAYLRSVTFQGRSGTWGGSVKNNIGSGKDSEASDSIISIVDKNDSRPVWFCFWGDCSNLAQAIWKVQNTRSADELKIFLSKIRIYQIAHQDYTIDWLLENFPDLFIIYSQSTFYGIFGGPNDIIGNLSWINTNIRYNHGPLGAVYPPAAMGVDGLKEGDTPSFLYLVSAAHGLNDPEDPTQESWGGQFVHVDSTNHWIDDPGGSSISKWKSEYQAEFALRASWMLDTSVIAASTVLPTGFIINVVFNSEMATPELDAELIIQNKAKTKSYSVKSIALDSLNAKQYNITLNVPVLKNEAIEISDSTGLLKNSAGESLSAFTCYPVNFSTLTKYTSINDVKSSFEIYPNPCGDLITIKLSYNADNQTYHVIDLFGRVLKADKLNSSLSNLNISDLPKGNYMLRVFTDNTSIVKQVVKLY